MTYKITSTFQTDEYNPSKPYYIHHEDNEPNNKTIKSLPPRRVAHVSVTTESKRSAAILHDVFKSVFNNANTQESNG